MKKCASYSARAGESNAIFSSRIGPILTNPHSILSLRTHPVGFFRNFAHTHTRVRFFVKIDPCWKINKNSEKCEKMCIRFSAQGWPGWCRGPDLGDFIDLHRHQQQPARTTTSTPAHPVGSFGDCAKLKKKKKKKKKTEKNVNHTWRGQGSRLQPSPAGLASSSPSLSPFFAKWDA